MTAFRNPVGLPPLKEVKTDRRIAEDGGGAAAVDYLADLACTGRPHVLTVDVWQEWGSVAAITVITPYLVLVSAKYVQSREKVLVRGCEKFLPALA